MQRPLHRCAVFAALGGSAYAASKISGGNIVNQSIAGKKLKNGTITNKQIKKGTITSAQIQTGSLNSTVINVSTLGTVPSAQSAVTATSRNWIQAAQDCGDEGGRLPSLGELVAFISQPGPQVAAHNWPSDVADLEGGVEVVITSDELGRAKALGSSSFGYRCLFYRSN